MSSIDRLIQDLTHDARPVRRLRPPRVRLGLWLGVALATLLVAVWLQGPRHDLVERLTDPTFLVQFGLAAACTVAAARSAFVLGVPGAERRLSRLVPAVILAAWAAWMVYRMASFVSDPRIWWEVIRGLPLTEVGTGFAIALVPGLWLLVMIRRAAPLRPGWAGGLALLAAGGVSFMADMLSCGSFCPIHAVALHLLPVLASGLVGVGCGWWLLRRVR